MDELHFSHVPVLLDACLEGLNIRPDGIYVDGTAGGAGHSRAIAERLDGGRLIALDKDPDAVAVASQPGLRRLAAQRLYRAIFQNCVRYWTSWESRRSTVFCSIWACRPTSLTRRSVDFPTRMTRPLDMRMTKTGLSARDVVNTYSFKDLCRVFRDYGEEKFAPAIAKNILKSRTQRPIATTAELAAIIGASIPARARREGGNPGKARLSSDSH